MHIYIYIHIPISCHGILSHVEALGDRYDDLLHVSEQDHCISYQDRGHNWKGEVLLDRCGPVAHDEHMMRESIVIRAVRACKVFIQGKAPRLREMFEMRMHGLPIKVSALDALVCCLTLQPLSCLALYDTVSLAQHKGKAQNPRSSKSTLDAQAKKKCW